MTVPLRPGDVLEGFCGGHFGRDSYADKRIEAIGADWVVARTASGHVAVATFSPGYRPEEFLLDYRQERQ